MGRFLLDEETACGNVAVAPQKQALGRAAVAAGTAGLLVVGLHGAGHVEMGHVAHVRLVDAHAEGVGGHHDRGLIVHEGPLVALALVGQEPRMVTRGRDAPLAQVVADLLHRRPLGAVDDARLGPSLVDELVQARELLLGLAPFHGEAQVRAVEARHGAGRVLKAQKAHDVAAHEVGGRGRERRHGRPNR